MYDFLMLLFYGSLFALGIYLGHHSAQKEYWSGIRDAIKSHKQIKIRGEWYYVERRDDE